MHTSRAPAEPRGRDHRHFSLIRSFHLADLLTLANGYCGMAGVFAALAYLRTGEARHIEIGVAFVALALIFDVLDGRVARARGTSSPLGRELDSLADVISFGVAPAVLVNAMGFSTPADALVLIYFALCGLSRLARYNITAETLAARNERVTHFEGTPIPTSIVPLLLALVAFERDNLLPVSLAGIEFHLPVLLFLLSGTLMVSRTLRIPKP